jgi:hypothetical protein
MPSIIIVPSKKEFFKPKEISPTIHETQNNQLIVKGLYIKVLAYPHSALRD